MKGINALRSAGVFGEVVSLDRSLTKNGCAYGIGFDCHQSSEVERILGYYKIGYGEMIGGSR